MNPTEPKPHSHYFKSVRGLEEIDVYRVIELFEVTHPALQHALKKVMAAGKRGAKDSMQDVQEAIDSLKRYQQMAQEDLQRPYQRPVHEGWLNGHHQDSMFVVHENGAVLPKEPAQNGINGNPQEIAKRSTTISFADDGTASISQIGGLNGHPQELIDSWKPGDVWQFTNIDGEWRECAGQPHWREGVQYRKKPEAPYVPSDNIIEPDPADPHRELRKTYKPGQRWMFSRNGGSDWFECHNGKFDPVEPDWVAYHKYRRHPDDKDPE